jgi:cGMP-dependent 3',5'-cyclic phosphodiesterase
LQVFDGDIPDGGGTRLENGVEVRLPASKGIAGHVASTGNLLNIADAQAHPLFYRNIDQITGFITRCVEQTNG